MWIFCPHGVKDAHEDGVRKLAMTSDSKYLISGSLDYSIKIWDFATRQLVHHFENVHSSICYLSGSLLI